MKRAYKPKLGQIGLCALALAAAGSANAAVSIGDDQTNVQLYGYLEGKLSYDIGARVDDPLGLWTFRVPLDSEAAGDLDGHTHMSANQSRLGLRFNHGDVFANVEGDFLNNEFRIRHAYFVVDNLLIGQTWSNYSGFISSMPSVQFYGLNGAGGAQNRLAQVRYTMGNLSVSAERAAPSLVGAADAGAAPRNSLPWFTARYELSAGPAAFTFGGATQYLTAESDTDSDSAIGLGGFVAARYVNGPVTVRGNVNYSDGLNTNFHGLYQDDAHWVNGELETVEAIGGTLSVGINVGPGAINLGYGRIEIDHPNVATADTRNETLQHAAINYMWTTASNVTYGVEYNWHNRERVDGEEGDIGRLVFLGRYSF